MTWRRGRAVVVVAFLLATLVPGDEVYLDDERRLVVSASPLGTPPSSDTATMPASCPVAISR